MYLRFSDTRASTEIPKHRTTAIASRNFNLLLSVNPAEKRLRHVADGLKKVSLNPSIYMVEPPDIMPLQNDDSVTAVAAIFAIDSPPLDIR